AWQALGTYHHFVAPDSVAALAAYGRALDIYPNYAPTWNNLALVHIDLGDYDAARSAILTAMRLAPHDPLYKVTYAALLMAVYDELDEAEALSTEALALDPSNADALLLAGQAALRRGRTADAVEAMLKATVANPGLAGATTSLGIAYYHARQFEAARKTIENAMRLDPRDPVPPLIGSIMAQDQAEVGRAIRLAHEAIQRYEGFQNFAVESLAKSRSGIVNMGSAYANLGLNEWGEYYGQLSFNPAWATSHLFLANQYASLEARRAEATQGLLLDPLAVSARNRYYDFVNQPFHDLTLGAGVGSEESAITNTQAGTLQGFVRLPTPVSYFVNFSRLHRDGPRTNSDRTDESGLAAVGVKLDERHQLLGSLGGS
ncbi:MAG TPA: tetratricopeptide repeat protein, partial [Solirubrobacterales bacterium]|nr:tetratricopeptide repeat protein [Solirubrobacterales bacterium]